MRILLGFFSVFAMAGWSILQLAGSACAADEAYEKIWRDGAFVLAHNRYGGVSVGVDTTQPEMLKLAIEVQETLLALDGARPPIQHLWSSGVAGGTDLGWQMIYFIQDRRSTGEQPAYTVSWEFHQPRYSINCSKRLRITYDEPADAREAIEFIFKKELGAGLQTADSEVTPRPLLYLTTQMPEKSQKVVVRQIAIKE